MRLVALTALALLVSACNDRASEPPRARTVLEFLEDEAALEKAWAACRADPGGIGRAADCANAGDAKQRLMVLGRNRAIASANKGKG